MDTAVIEFNSLTDTIWAAAEDDNLFLLCRLCFTRGLIRGIQVWRKCLEFSAAGIHVFEDWPDCLFLTVFPYGLFFNIAQIRQIFIGITILLGLSQHLPVHFKVALILRCRGELPFIF